MRAAVDQVAATVDVTDVDAWFAANEDRLVRQIRAGWTVSRGLGARYMRQHGVLNGVRVDPVLTEWIADQARTSLRVTGPVAFKTHMSISGEPAASAATMRETLTGGAARRAVSGSRDTVNATISNSEVITGWRRVTDGTPCAFCSMLASRGGVYGEATVEFNAHDNDSCTAEPLYEIESEPADVAELREQWQQHGGNLEDWRRHWDTNPEARARFAEIVAAR